MIMKLKSKGVALTQKVSLSALNVKLKQFGFDYIDTFHRTIPNKRMPLRNSPTNAAGAVDNTMTREHIVVMRRRG